MSLKVTADERGERKPGTLSLVASPGGVTPARCHCTLPLTGALALSGVRVTLAVRGALAWEQHALLHSLFGPGLCHLPLCQVQVTGRKGLGRASFEAGTPQHLCTMFMDTLQGPGRRPRPGSHTLGFLPQLCVRWLYVKRITCVSRLGRHFK